jgi:hypothetical protein
MGSRYKLLRFFPSGVILEVTVKGQSSCQETWDYIAPYLFETATDTFNHGEYQLEGDTWSNSPWQDGFQVESDVWKRLQP